ncbi:MAG: hypothetical protein IT380_05005 [Myxococcales bacterium]|nr:hypothetical protein [Myxococcales bacterium]
MVAAERARRYAPIELEDPAHAIAAAFARKGVDDALERLSGGDGSPDAREPALVIELAQLLAGRGDARTASQRLRALVARPLHQQTARALVILARPCIEKLGAAEEGQRLYRACWPSLRGRRPPRSPPRSVPPSPDARRLMSGPTFGYLPAP